MNRHYLNTQLRNEKGIALVTVLILALIALTIISSLIFLVTQGTKVSGFYKRYSTALDAGYGGAEIVTSLIHNRGELIISGLSGINYTTQCVCAFDNDPSDEVYSLPSPDTCLCRKLCIPPYKSDLTYNWGVAGTGICPSTGASMDAIVSPDMQFSLSGAGTESYLVSAKIIDTTIGVTDMSGELLSCGTGTGYPCEGFQGTPTPYLYRIEVDTRTTTEAGATDPSKSPIKNKSRLSILYAF